MIPSFRGTFGSFQSLRTFTAKHFREGNGAILLGKAARQRFYTRFHPLGTALRRLLRRQMRAVVREFEERGRGVPSPAPAGESQP